MERSHVSHLSTLMETPGDNDELVCASGRLGFLLFQGHCMFGGFCRRLYGSEIISDSTDTSFSILYCPHSNLVSACYYSTPDNGSSALSADLQTDFDVQLEK